mgnify:CR=1 FL=1
MRISNLDGVVPFGIFDRSRVGFSVESPISRKYLVTLVTTDSDVVDEFYEIFELLWNASTPYEVTSTFARLLLMR